MAGLQSNNEKQVSRNTWWNDSTCMETAGAQHATKARVLYHADHGTWQNHYLAW